MLVPHRRSRGKRGSLRQAFRHAQETYKQYSQAPDMSVAPASHEPVARPRDAVVRSQDPDVMLDIPTLKVDEIDLELDELHARVALEAHVLDLLKLDVGVDASLGRVDLEIKGVEAQAFLKVRLDNLATILDRVMDTVDRNPQVLERLLDQVGRTVDQVGSTVGDVTGTAGAVVEEAGKVAGELGRNSSSPDIESSASGTYREDGQAS